MRGVESAQYQLKPVEIWLLLANDLGCAFHTFILLTGSFCHRFHLSCNYFGELLLSHFNRTRAKKCLLVNAQTPVLAFFNSDQELPSTHGVIFGRGEPAIPDHCTMHVLLRLDDGICLLD